VAFPVGGVPEGPLVQGSVDDGNLPYLENQSTTALRERQSNRPNHAGDLRQPAPGGSLTAKLTAKW
jgi:hypothetical protein